MFLKINITLPKFYLTYLDVLSIEYFFDNVMLFQIIYKLT